MSMTREEIIKAYEDAVVASGLAAAAGNEEAAKFYELFKAGLSALRAVSREQVEKVWRGCEWCNGEHSNNGEISAYAEVECEGCDAGDDCPNAHSSEDPCYGMVDRALPVNFCPVCGRAMTDEAVEMVMERLEALHGEKEAD